MPVSRIIGIFEKIKSPVMSRYTESLIESKDDKFALYLSYSMSFCNIKKWEKNPNDEKILADVARDGFDFYNFYYLGNS